MTPSACSNSQCRSDVVFVEADVHVGVLGIFVLFPSQFSSSRRLPAAGSFPLFALVVAGLQTGDFEMFFVAHTRPLFSRKNTHRLSSTSNLANTETNNERLKNAGFFGPT